MERTGISLFHQLQPRFFKTVSKKQITTEVIMETLKLSVQLTLFVLYPLFVLAVTLYSIL
jgi:hypothetical protein